MKNFLLLTVSLVLVGGCAAGLSNQTSKDIKARLASKQPQFEKCYQTALDDDDQTAGSMTLAFVVTPDGKFRKVTVAKSNVNDTQLERCVVRQAQGLRTRQEVAAPVAVTYRLDFEANEGDL